MQINQSMKDSGVAWLGMIPSDWSLLRGKFIYRNKKENNKGLVEPQRLALTLKGVIEREDGDDVGLNPESLESYQIFNTNDLVFKLIDLENKKTSRVGLVPRRGIMSPAYIRLSPESNVCARYFFYYYYSLYLTYVFNNIAGEGVRANLSPKELLEITLPVPKYDVQVSIANYLDEETAKIDNLIAKQERMLKLLEEKRRATMLKAITSGLNDEVELKSTKIQWMPFIPASWNLVKIGYLVKILSGYSPEQTNPAEQGRYPYYKVDALNYLDKLGALQSTKDYIENNKFIEEPPYLVFPKRGGAIFTNKVGLVNVNSSFDTNLMGVRVNSLRLSIEFMHHWLLARTLSELADTSTLPQINNKHILPLQIGLPCLDEQEEIVNFIKLKQEEFDLLKQKINSQVLLLKERRISLISNVVTGKVKI